MCSQAEMDGKELAEKQMSTRLRRLPSCLGGDDEQLNKVVLLLDV